MAQEAKIQLKAYDDTRSAFDAIGRRFASLQKQVDSTSSRMRALGNVAAGLGAALGIGAAINKFVAETKNAEQEQAQLAAVLKSTGEAAGFSIGQLNAMAEAMARQSTFSSGEINRAQTRLLSYTGIVGEQFPKAMQAAIDTAARMGMSIEQAAETVGRALDVPSAGLSSLSKQGFRFTEEQKKMVAELERTGRTAEAQEIVLQALESSYGGAAKAARDTFGGAVAALQNEINNLMTGKDGSLDGVRGSIESLIETLQSDSVRQGFSTIIGALAKVVEWAAKGAAAVASMTTSVAEGVAKFVHGTDEPLERAKQLVNETSYEVRVLSDEISRLQRINTRGQFDAQIAELQSRLEATNAQLKMLRAAQAELERGPIAASPTAAASAPKPVAGPADAAALAGAEEQRKRAADAYKRAVQEANRYLENLKQQLRATKDLTVEETVLMDLREGRIKAAGGVTEQQLIALAREIDQRRQAKELLEAENKAREEAARLNRRTIEAVEQEADAIAQQNQSLREQIEEIGKNAREVADLRAKRLEHAAAIEEETAAMLRNAGASDAEVAARERKARLLRGQASLVREEAEKAAADLDDFAKNAAENIQRYLGESFAQIMEGNFKDIEKSFVSMINRMVAEALAADLSRALFGSLAGGEGGGLLGSAAKYVGGLFGSIFGGGRASGGSTTPGLLHPIVELGEPEVLTMGDRRYLVTPEAGVVEPLRERSAGVGRNVTININQHFAPGTDYRTVSQAAAEVQRALQQGARNL